MLYGRERHQAEIDGLVNGAREGHSGALLLVGEPGIGKSALLGYASERARGVRLLQAVGMEGEAELAYAALEALLWPGLDRLTALPDPQREALGVALGRAAGPRPDRFLVGLAALSLLGELAADGPVLCLIDDAQWLDQESAAVLGFLARRLREEGVAFLFAARSGFELPGVRTLTVEGLDRDSAQLLLERLAPTLPRAAQARVLSEAGGNPLALAAFPELAGGLLSSAPIPLPARIENAYRSRIAMLAEPARTLLSVLAADESGSLGHLPRVAEILGEDAGAEEMWQALGQAQTAGLVQVDGTSVSFRHPLMRSAAYQGTDLALRRRIHRALAEAMDGAQDVDQRAWHLAAAATGYDEDAASALEAAAERAGQRGGCSAKASVLVRAAELTSDVAARGRRLAVAAGAAWLAGPTARANELAELAEPLVSGDRERAELYTLRARAAFDRGAPHRAIELFLNASALLEPYDAPAAAYLLLDAYRSAHYAGDLEAGIRAHARLREISEHVDPAPFMVASANLYSFHGEPEAAIALQRDIIGNAGRFPQITLSDKIGTAFLLGDFTSARTFAAAAVEHCRRVGAIGLAPMALAQLAITELYLGHFTDARAAAEEGLRIGEDTDQDHRAAHHHAALAWVAAVQGDQEPCRRHAALALARFSRDEVPLTASWAVWALAMLDLGLGRWAEALARLEEAETGAIGRQVTAVYWAPDQVEAAVRLGRPEAAERPMARFRRYAEASDEPWAKAVLARCRALLEPAADEAEAHYQAAVDCPDRRFEQARSALLYGEWLRRARRNTDARTLLRRSAEDFDLLTAPAWADRARAELRAAGESTAPAAKPRAFAQTAAPTALAVDLLTPQELQIARLAAAGETNRQIAARLFLSPKTVGHHLYRAFPKLGVATRVELAHVNLD